MPKGIPDRHGACLEGLCCPAAGQAGAFSIWAGSGAPGMERMEVRIAGNAFAPHRHDTYALGMTLSGVQTFRYRGEQRYCLPAQGHILHPDELHDGSSVSASGFRYRIVYIDPHLVCRALGGRPLPFVPDPVVPRPDLLSALRTCLADIDTPVGDVEAADMCAALADMLDALAANSSARPARLDMASLLRVRERIAACPAAPVSAQELEAIAQIDRWTVARQFRAAFGTSPSRFRTMRQLDLARRLIGEGKPCSEVALDAGFSDQSHLTRMFKRTYGLTPGQWAAAWQICLPG